MEFLVIWLACGLICYALAKGKGKNEWIALGVGVLFSFFAVIYYVLCGESPEHKVRKAKEIIQRYKNILE